jgi:hypothetical protein
MVMQEEECVHEAYGLILLNNVVHFHLKQIVNLMQVSVRVEKNSHCIVFQEVVQNISNGKYAFFNLQK